MLKKVTDQQEPLKLEDLERIRGRIGNFVSTLPGEKALDSDQVIRVKGKVLNQFLGFLKTDIARLSFEAFPEYINKQLISLMLLDRQDLIWFDIQIERRVATLRVNLFVGENAGNRVFKVGVLCLIGIAHLTEVNRDLKFSRRFEVRPFRQLNLCPRVQEELGQRAPGIDKILMNLFHAIKLVCAKTLVHVPISGNISLTHNGMLMSSQTPGIDNLLASQFAYDTEEQAVGGVDNCASAVVVSPKMTSTGVQIAGMTSQNQYKNHQQNQNQNQSQSQSQNQKNPLEESKIEDRSGLMESAGPMTLSQLNIKQQNVSNDRRRPEGEIYAQVYKPPKVIKQQSAASAAYI